MESFYLVIVNHNTGISQLNNRAIVMASNKSEAKDKFIEDANCGDSIRYELSVENIDVVSKI